MALTVIVGSEEGPPRAIDTERARDTRLTLRPRRSRASAAPCRRDSGDVDLLLPIIASDTLGFGATDRQRVDQHARRDLQEMPLSLHQPHALSWPPLPTMAFQ